MERRNLERKGARELADAAMVSRSAWYRRMAAEGLDRVVRFGEPWIRYLDGGPETTNDGTLESRLAQVEENRSRLQSLIRRFEAEGSWDMTFVDAECDSPQVFSYGAVMLHVMAYGDHARVDLDLELRRRGLLEGWVPPV